MRRFVLGGSLGWRLGMLTLAATMLSHAPSTLGMQLVCAQYANNPTILTCRLCLMY